MSASPPPIASYASANPLRAATRRSVGQPPGGLHRVRRVPGAAVGAVHAALEVLDEHAGGICTRALRRAARAGRAEVRIGRTNSAIVGLNVSGPSTNGSWP